MIGCSSELDLLNSLYESSQFEYLVMYGRRRVGKTTLLQEFAKDKKAVFFLHRRKMTLLTCRIFPK